MKFYNKCILQLQSLSMIEINNRTDYTQRYTMSTKVLSLRILKRLKRLAKSATVWLGIINIFKSC